MGRPAARQAAADPFTGKKGHHTNAPGCGLRVSETLRLRLKHLDLGEGRLCIYQPKGNTSSVGLFPECLREPLERQMPLASLGFRISDSDLLPAPLWLCSVTRSAAMGRCPQEPSTLPSAKR